MFFRLRLNYGFESKLDLYRSNDFTLSPEKLSIWVLHQVTSKGNSIKVGPSMEDLLDYECDIKFNVYEQDRSH